MAKDVVAVEITMKVIGIAGVAAANNMIRHIDHIQMAMPAGVDAAFGEKLMKLR